jgi:hypothetical protein
MEQITMPLPTDHNFVLEIPLNPCGGILVSLCFGNLITRALLKVSTETMWVLTMAGIIMLAFAYVLKLAPVG